MNGYCGLHAFGPDRVEPTAARPSHLHPTFQVEPQARVAESP